MQQDWSCILTSQLFTFHPVYPLHPVQRFWNPLNFEIWGNLEKKFREDLKDECRRNFRHSALHFILFILSILSKDSPTTF